MYVFVKVITMLNAFSILFAMGMLWIYIYPGANRIQLGAIHICLGAMAILYYELSVNFDDL